MLKCKFFNKTCEEVKGLSIKLIRLRTITKPRVKKIMLKLILREFKSIDYAELDLKPITVLIGKPDSGKSNTIEALGLLTYLTYGGTFEHYFRATSIYSLSHFYMGRPSIVKLTDRREGPLINLYLNYNMDALTINLRTEFNKKLDFTIHIYPKGGHSFTIPEEPKELENLLNIRFYRYHTYPVTSKIGHGGFILNKLVTLDKSYQDIVYSTLLPPHGENLNMVLMRNEKAYEIVNDICEEIGYDEIQILTHPYALRPDIVFTKVINNKTMAFSIQSLAYGVMTYILNLLAIKLSLEKELMKIPNIIMLEEPEIHTFPYLIKKFAETLAHEVKIDKHKIIVLTTHNPYLLITLLEKCPLDLMQVYWVQRSKKTFITRYIALTHDNIKELLDYGTAALYMIEDIIKERAKGKNVT